jgi:hypothetical protein
MAIDINIPSQVKNYANLAAFPATGSLKTIFIAEDTNKTYRWTGSAYVEISASQATAWGAITGTLSNQTDLQNALNAKQDTLVSATNIKTINGTTLLGSGDITVGGGVTIGTTAITSGTVGRVLFEGTGNVVQESANFSWDNTNAKLLINGGFIIGADFVASSSAFKISGTDATLAIRSTSSGGFCGMNMYDNANNNIGSFQIGGTATGSPFAGNMFIGARQPTGRLLFVRGVSATQSMTLFSTGNLLIQDGGTHTDAGFKLDVNGTARVQGQITTTTANAQFGTIGASTGEFRVDGVNGAGYAFSVYSSSTLRFGVVGFGGVQMPSGFTITSGSTDLTTTRLRIGTGNSTGAINIMAQSGNTDVVSFKASNGTDQFTIKNTSGNTLIGTSTDAGFKLDVNGTARVSASAQNVFQISGTNAVATRIDINHATNTGFQLSLSSVRKWSIATYGAGDFTFYNDVLTSDALFIKGNTNNVIIGSTTDVASALLNVTSTTKGFLPPRMTTTQKNAIASPATGLIVYDLTLNLPQFYNGTIWVSL